VFLLVPPAPGGVPTDKLCPSTVPIEAMALRGPDGRMVPVLQQELTQRKPPERQALPNAGVDAGRKSVTVTGEVSLDIPLHGKKFKLRFRITPA